MLVFIVPLKSEKVSSDWEGFLKLFERSIKSICAQKDQNFKVIVSCHEIPKINFSHKNLSYTSVDFEPPNTKGLDWDAAIALKEADKANKIKVGVALAKKEFDPSYYMVVDSDDCIANTISSFVNKNANKQVPGWYFKKGYFYREGKSYAFLNTKAFNQFCGTCIIVRSDNIDKLLIHQPGYYYNHRVTTLDEKSELIPFPFPAALYSMGNGENHHMSNERINDLTSRPKSKAFGMLKSLISKAKKYRPVLLTPWFRKKFGFYKV